MSGFEGSGFNDPGMKVCGVRALGFRVYTCLELSLGVSGLRV